MTTSRVPRPALLDRLHTEVVRRGCSPHILRAALPSRFIPGLVYNAYDKDNRLIENVENRIGKLPRVRFARDEQFACHLVPNSSSLISRHGRAEEGSS
jgi:hypothetical protein